jgi:hypothetical protein
LSIQKRSTFKDFENDSDINTLFDWINAFTEVVNFTVVAPGAATSVTHTLEYVPRMALQVVRSGNTGTGSVYDGGVAWTNRTVSLTATAAGTYSVLIRR